MKEPISYFWRHRDPHLIKLLGDMARAKGYSLTIYFLEIVARHLVSEGEPYGYVKLAEIAQLEKLSRERVKPPKYLVKQPSRRA